MIDKQSSTPIYLQIQRYMKEQITNGDWMIGSAIPSERSLSQQLSVSRMTVRHAIQGLIEDGILTTVRGRGTFVTDVKVEQQLLSVSSFTNIIQKKGKQPKTNMIAFSKREASKEEAAQLQLKEKDAVLWVERVRLADDVPMVYETTTIPWTIASPLTEKDIEHSLYEAIEKKLSLTIGKAKQSIEAAASNKKIADLLEIEQSAPILKVERLTHLDNGSPFEYVRSFYAGERYKFYLEIDRS